MDKIVIYDTETTNSTIWGSIIEVHKIERRTAPHYWPFFTPRLSLEGEMERNCKIERAQQLA